MLLHVLFTKVGVLSSGFIHVYINLFGHISRAGSFINLACVNMVIYLLIKGLNQPLISIELTVIVFLTEVSVLSKGLLLTDSLSLSHLCFDRGGGLFVSP